MTMPGKGMVSSLIVVYAMVLISFFTNAVQRSFTHTKDLGQIHGVHIVGQDRRIYHRPQLALKHRENKNLRQHIIVSAASPMESPREDGKVSENLKKKKVEMG